MDLVLLLVISVLRNFVKIRITELNTKLFFI